jgi:hypothetical protein
VTHKEADLFPSQTRFDTQTPLTTTTNPVTRFFRLSAPNVARARSLARGTATAGKRRQTTRHQMSKSGNSSIVMLQFIDPVKPQALLRADGRRVGFL